MIARGGLHDRSEMNARRGSAFMFIPVTGTCVRTTGYRFFRITATVAIVAVIGLLGFTAEPAFAVPSNDDCSGAIVIPSGSLPYVTAPINITQATPAGTDDPIFTCAE